MTQRRGYTVCGAIGPWALAAVDELRSRLGLEGEPSLARADVVFHARGTVGRWSEGDAHGWSWGQARNPPAPPRSWEDVARDGAAGLVVAERTVTLHADAAGVVPLFVARHGDAVLFSSSLDALAWAYPGGRLHVDRAAWWELLASSGVMSTRTPFEELRRLAPGRALRLDPTGLLVDHEVARWPDPAPVRGIEDAADELVERVRAVTHRSLGHALTVPLSGGWDSRFLAAAAVADGRPTSTVTAADDLGRLEEEVAWARQVADRLGLPHEVLPAPARWWDTFTAAAADTHHLTSLHHWFEPLKDHLAGVPGTVQDGLAAGVVLRNGMLSDDAARGTSDAARTAVATRLASPVRPTELLAPDLADQVDEHVAERLASSWDTVADHPAAPTLQVLALRTSTAIALAPMSMLAQVADVVTPFTAREVLEVALAVPVADKAGGRLYREVMARLGQGLEVIPSSNDTTTERRRDPRPDLAADVAARTRRALRHEHVHDAVGPRLRARIGGGRILQPGDRRHRDVVRGLALYTVWATRYAPLLADPALVAPRGGTWGAAPPPTDRSPEVIAGSELPDPRWLPHQVEGRTVLLRVERGVTPSGSTTGSGAEDGWRVRVSEVAAEDRPGSEPGGSYERVLLAGPWPTLGALERTLIVASSSLAPGGRIVVSAPLTRAPADAEGPAVLETCELLVDHLRPVHAEVRQGRVRLVAHPRPEPGQGHRVPPLLLAAIVAGLESRELAARDRAAQLQRELRDARQREAPRDDERHDERQREADRDDERHDERQRVADHDDERHDERPRWARARWWRTDRR